MVGRGAGPSMRSRDAWGSGEFRPWAGEGHGGSVGHKVVAMRWNRRALGHVVATCHGVGRAGGHMASLGANASWASLGRRLGAARARRLWGLAAVSAEVFSFPLWSPSFCEQLWEELHHYEREAVGEPQKARPGSPLDLTSGMRHAASAGRGRSIDC